MREAIPHLRKSHGRVVFVSSGAAVTPYLAWGNMNSFAFKFHLDSPVDLVVRLLRSNKGSIEPPEHYHSYRGGKHYSYSHQAWSCRYPDAD
jgi:hypothetical protein